MQGERGASLRRRLVYLTYISAKYLSLSLLSQFTRYLSVYLETPTNHSSTSSSCHLLWPRGGEGGGQGFNLAGGGCRVTIPVVAVLLVFFLISRGFM